MTREVATLRDVAKMAGVSTGTVSKYLNEPQSVKEKNRLAIASSIKTLNYTPNTLAQRLAKGRSNVILLYIATENNISASTWLHQLPLIQTLNGFLQHTGYSLQIKMGSIDQFDEADEYIRQCIDSKNIDGVALLSAWTFPKKNILTLVQKEFPFVLMDNRNPLINTGEVSCDNTKMVEDLMDYLIALGHQKIAFINVKTSQQHMHDRFSGYVKSVKRHDLDDDPRLILFGDFSINSGFRCVSELLKEGVRPTAIVSGNDNMAVGAIKAVRSAGLLVPGDISIVGIDNSIVAQAVDPVLTTMQMPLEEMGKAAIEGLLRKIADPNYDIVKYSLSGHIIEGASAGPAKGSA